MRDRAVRSLPCSFAAACGRWLVVLMVCGLGFSLISCGLIKMPFRVAGSVAHHVYATGKRGVKATSQALETRKLRNAQEAKQQAQAQAKKDAGKPANPPPGQLQPLAPPAAPAPPAPGPAAVPEPPPGFDPDQLPPLPDELPGGGQ